MTILHLDLESFSTADLQREGLYRYAADPSTDLLVVCYAFDEGPVNVWVPLHYKDLPRGHSAAMYALHYYCGLECPPELADHIRSGGQVRAHNAAFERIVLNGVAGQRHGVPPLKIEQMVCTMAKMAAHGLPHSLENAAEALGTHPKSKTGRTDMLYLCKPRADGTRPTPQEEPERFLRLYSYCVDDVEAERGIDRVVPDLSPNEQKVYELDQRMNDRGWKVDLESIGNAQFLIDQYKAELAGECKRITGLSVSQTGKLADWVREHGYPQLTDLQVGTVNAAVLDPNCPAEVKKVLNLFSTHNMKAVTKYNSMARAAGADGRLRGMFTYHGANTGRWSSKIVQLQNLYRPKIDDPETAVEAFRQRDLRWLRELYDIGPMKVLASCVRSVLVAEEGHDLLFLDYAAIEARVNAWLWDQHDVVEAYRAYDAGTGPDLYELAYAKAFRKPVSAVSPKERFIGKIMILALGYSGGAGAFAKIGRAFPAFDLDAVADEAYRTMPPDVLAEAQNAWLWAVDQKRTSGLEERAFIACDGLKRLWRNAHPRIVSGWAELETAARNAIQWPGQIMSTSNKRIMFKVEDQWLHARLPSGRRLAYFKPEINFKNEISFMGVDTYTRQWCRTTTFSGKLDENMVQAISRDLLVAAKFKLERAGYPIIGSVHDEAILEPTEGFGSYDDAAAIMCDSPKWAAGLPVAVEGHRAKRYRK